MKQELSRTFLDNIYLEKEVEKLKIELAHQTDFTCLDAYHLILQSEQELGPDQFTTKIFDFIQTGLYDQR